MNNREGFLAAAGEDKETLARIFDRAFLCEKQGRAMFTDFLSEREYSQFLLRQKHIETPFSASGGYEGAARVMLGFSTDGEECPFPISAVVAAGKGVDKLRHGDFLGSIMHLGLDRSCIGDIVKNTESWVIFCTEAIAPFIADSLIQVGGVFVESSVQSVTDVSVTSEFEEITGTVASLRADSVVSVMLKTSRSKAAEYITGQRFFLNQVLCTKCDKEIRENDILTVRHHGKARLASISGRSKKGRIFITIKKYM